MGVERGAILHAGGLRTHVLKSGRSGAPVFLLHGQGSLGQDILAPLREAAPDRLFVAPDRPGYGLSEPLRTHRGPIGQAHWLRWVIDAVGGAPPVIVAHSMGAGAALAFATLYPDRLRGLVLVAPFCRPTPHALRLGLRLATMPVVGPWLRQAVVPHLATRIGERRMRRASSASHIPKSVQDFSFTHAAQPGAQQAMADEWRAFNRDMSACRRKVRRLRTPVHVLCAPDDRTIDFAWHVGWLTAWCETCVLHFLRGGHLTHYSQPEAILSAIRALEAQTGARRAA